MSFFTKDQKVKLIGNRVKQRVAQRQGATELIDFEPVVKLNLSSGEDVWYLTELKVESREIVTGVRDYGFGCGEMTCFDLTELAAMHRLVGERISCDPDFEAKMTISEYLEEAWRT